MMGIKEMIEKVLDRDASLAKKIWMLFGEQSVTIELILMATEMAIGILVEALSPSDTVAIQQYSCMPGIIGTIISWILNRVKKVVGWLLRNLWALVIGVGGLLYMYMVTRK